MEIIIYLLIISSYIFSKGFFSLGGVLILVSVCILMVMYFLGKLPQNIKIFSFNNIYLILANLTLILYGGLYQQKETLIILSFLLLGFNLFLSFKLVIYGHKQSTKKYFISIFFILIIVRLFMIWSSPVPLIDVFDYLKQGALLFARGINPYSAEYTKLYTDFIPNYYAYPPGMLFFTFPFVFFLKDPRYAIIYAEIIIALIVLKIAKRQKDRYLKSLLFLVNPISLYMIEQSYTEPIIVFLILLTVYFLKNKNKLLAGFTLGLLMATKQYIFLVIPLVYKLILKIKKYSRILLLSLLVFLIIFLPFYFWSPKDFIDDVLTLQFGYLPRYEGLSFFAFLFRMGIPYSWSISYLIISSFSLFIYWQKKVNEASFFYLASFLFLVFFFFNKWAFINYYYLISQLFLLGIIFDKQQK